MKEKIKKYFGEFKTNPQVIKKIEEILQNEKYATKEITPAQIQLKSLEAENLINIKHAKIDFANNKIIELKGENGIGKTLLSEDITLLLNNFGRDSLNNIVSRETINRLDFDITIEGKEYSHSIIIDKTKWARLENGVLNLTGQTEIMKYYKSVGMDDIFREVIKLSDTKSYITDKDPAPLKTFFMKFFDIAAADKVKDDIGGSIKYNKSDIDSLHGQKTALMTGEGPNEINAKIQTIKNDLKKHEGIEKEYTSIVTKGSEGIVKLQNTIDELIVKKVENEELLNKIETTIVNKDVFKNFLEYQKEFKILNNEIDKINDKSAKHHKEITSFQIELGIIEKNIKILEKIESKCGICNSELSIIAKKLFMDSQKEQVESIKASITLSENNLAELKIDIGKIDAEEVDGKISRNARIIDHLAIINIKSQKGIDQIIEKYKVDDIINEINKIIEEIKTKNTQLDKLTEESPDKRKLELELQIKVRESLKVDLATWNEKKKNYEDQKENIEKINEKIKMAEFQDEILNKVLNIFDKNISSSFPVWYLYSSVKKIEEEINQELDKFKKLELKLRISTDFKIEIKGLNQKVLSGSELKIINLIFKLVIARQRFKKIPFFIMDEWKNGLENNTLNDMIEVLNHYIENGYLNNLVLTEPTLDTELIIKGSNKLDAVPITRESNKTKSKAAKS